MSSLINNALQSTADVVTLNQVRPSSDKRETPVAKELPLSTGKPITLPEDVVTLSSEVRGESVTSSPKKSSIPVSQDEKQALLGPHSTPKGFSVYG